MEYIVTLRDGYFENDTIVKVKADNYEITRIDGNFSDYHYQFYVTKKEGRVTERRNVATFKGSTVYNVTNIGK